MPARQLTILAAAIAAVVFGAPAAQLAAQGRQPAALSGIGTSDVAPIVRRLIAGVGRAAALLMKLKRELPAVIDAPGAAVVAVLARVTA